MIVKEVKLTALSRGLRLHQYLDNWLIRSQSREEALVSTQAVVDLTQPLGWIINQEKSELNPTQVFFLSWVTNTTGIQPLSNPLKRDGSNQDFILHLKSKHVFDCKMFDVSNWVATLSGENGPIGTTSHEALSVSHQGALEISSTTGQPPSWTEAISAHLDWWQNPAYVMKGSDLHPKDHSIQLFTDASNEGWGAHLEQNSTQGLWSPQEKGLHINVLELKAVFLALRHFKDQCQDQPVLVATDNSTVVAYINKQGGTHSVEMCTLLWRIMTWCHHFHITLKVRYIPGCLNVMADLLSRSNQVQSTEWSLHPQVFKQICQRWFTPHVDLFTTHLNHKLPLYVSPIPDPKAWDIDAGRVSLPILPLQRLSFTRWSKNQAMPLPNHSNSPRLARDALVLGPSAALNRDPTAAPCVDNTPQAVPQLRVPQQPAAPQPPRLVPRSVQLQEQGSSVEVAERIAAPQRSSTRTIYQSSGPYLKNGAEKIRWISPLHLWNKSQISSCICTKTLTSAPPPLMVTGLPLLTPWAHRANILLIMRTFIGCSPISTGIAPKVPEISPSGTFLLFSMSSQNTLWAYERHRSQTSHSQTAFLLALASCKRRSEIHAWVANKVSNQGHSEKVSLFPSSDFIAKNQLAREDSQSVSPVTIPALTTIVDRQFKKTGPCVRCGPWGTIWTEPKT